VHQHREIRRSRLEPDRQQRQQHQHRAGERVEEEFERGIDPPRPAPDPDDQVHRDQHGLEEHVEHDEIGGAEHADHHRLEDQEGDHELAHADVDRLPRREDADRRQHRREQHEQHADPVDAHLVADTVLRHPRHALDELKARLGLVEAQPQQQRQHQHDQAGPQRGPARIRRDGLLVAAHQHDDEHADERQESDQRQQGKAGGVHDLTGATGRG
jgi:hypothetical protein